MNAYNAQRSSKNSLLGNVAGAAGMAIGGFAEGGEAIAMPAGEVRGPGGPKDDAIDTTISDGEYVIPEEVVRRRVPSSLTS